MREKVSVAEVRQRWGELLDKVRYQGKRVIVTKHGAPRVAIVPIEDLEILQKYWPEGENERPVQDRN